MTSPDLPELIDLYLETLKDKRSAQTLRAYAADLRAYAQWVRAEAVEEEPLSLYQYVYQQGTWRTATRTRKRFALMKFYDWAYKAGLRSRNVARLLQNSPDPVGAPPQSRGLTLQGYRRVLATIPPTHLRDIVLFRLLAEAGLRVGEVQRLRRDAVEAVPGGGYLLRLIPGEREVFVTEPDLAHQLGEYLHQVPATQELLFQALWNGRGGPLRQSTIHSLWRRYADLVGVGGNPGQLRQLLYEQLAHQRDGTQRLRDAGLKSDTSILRYRRWRRSSTQDAAPVPEPARPRGRRTKRSF